MIEDFMPASLRDGRIFRVADWCKRPHETEKHGHHGARPALDYYYRPPGNWGLALDGDFIVMDYDDGGPEVYGKWGDATLPEPALIVQTRKGRHYYYRVPERERERGWRGRRAVRELVVNGKAVGDVLAAGYVVGPSSRIRGDGSGSTEALNGPETTYTVVYESPGGGEAPAFLLDFAAEGYRRLKSVDAGGIEPRGGVPRGMHDLFLTQQAGTMRGRMGLDAEAIARGLMGLVPMLMDMNPADPYTIRDMRRIAESICRHPATVAPETEVAILREGVTTYADAEYDEEPVRWILHDFIPRGDLTFVYGRGGIGKSTFASWVLANATRAGHNVGTLVTEEQRRVYMPRFEASGGDGRRAIDHDAAIKVKLPKHMVALERFITDHDLALLYIDAVASHFEDFKNVNAADRGRAIAAPLAALAQKTGCAILCTTHENSGGTFLNGASMQDVSRMTLRALRRNGGPLRIYVAKTNYEDPGYSLAFTSERKPVIKRDGTIAKDYDRGGNLVDRTISVLLPADDCLSDPETEDDLPPGMIDTSRISR